MAEKSCEGTQNHTAEALSLLNLSQNIIDRRYVHASGIERPSTVISQHCQQPLLQNTVDVNAATTSNVINSALNTQNSNPISLNSNFCNAAQSSYNNQATTLVLLPLQLLLAPIVRCEMSKSRQLL